MAVAQPMLFDHVDGPVGELVVKRVNYETARVPCEQWHYIGAMPGAGTYRYGIWEDGHFQGVIIFGNPIGIQSHKLFGAEHGEVLELLRIAMCGHTAPLTACISKSIKLLQADNPFVSVLLSYADPAAGHHGGIYQAASWTYLGHSETKPKFIINGVTRHSRGVIKQFHTYDIDFIQREIDAAAVEIPSLPKHKYAFALNRKMRKLLAGMAQPYPKGNA